MSVKVVNEENCSGCNLCVLACSFFSITGKSDKPIYLKINNGKVEFCNAQHLWGKDIWETTDYIWREAGCDYQVSAMTRNLCH